MPLPSLAILTDGITPLLSLILLYSLACRTCYIKHKFWPTIAFLFMLVSATYAMMLLDNALHIWPFLNLDYSTHTVLATSLVMIIFYRLSSKPIKLTSAIILVIYGYLMFILNYHTLQDMLTSVMFIFIIYTFLLSRIPLLRA